MASPFGHGLYRAWEDEGLTALKMDKLQSFLKALKVKPKARIGILGSKNARSGNLTNAVIGAAHEFGTSTLPQRSFLRVPIEDHIDARLQQSKMFDEAAIKKVLQEKSLVPWVTRAAIVAQAIVADAFNTGGFGKWQPSNMERKKVHQTLVETQQLRNSITYEVVDV